MHMCKCKERERDIAYDCVEDSRFADIMKANNACRTLHSALQKRMFLLFKTETSPLLPSSSQHQPLRHQKIMHDSKNYAFDKTQTMVFCYFRAFYSFLSQFWTTNVYNAEGILSMQGDF